MPPHNDLLIRCGAHWADSLFCTPPFLSILTSQLSSSSQMPLAAARVRPCPLQVTHRKGLKRRVGRGLCSEARQSPPARARLHSSKNHSFQKAGIRQQGQRGRGAHEASSPWLDTQMLPGKPTPTSPLTYTQSKNNFRVSNHLILRLDLENTTKNFLFPP